MANCLLARLVSEYPQEGCHIGLIEQMVEYIEVYPRQLCRAGRPRSEVAITDFLSFLFAPSGKQHADVAILLGIIIRDVV